MTLQNITLAEFKKKKKTWAKPLSDSSLESEHEIEEHFYQFLELLEKTSITKLFLF